MDKEKEVNMDILNWTKLSINLIELFNLPLYLLTISMESSQAIREKSIKFTQKLAFKCSSIGEKSLKMCFHV